MVRVHLTTLYKLDEMEPKTHKHTKRNKTKYQNIHHYIKKGKEK